MKPHLTQEVVWDYQTFFHPNRKKDGKFETEPKKISSHWLCDSWYGDDLIVGVGETPVEAYNSWVEDFNNHSGRRIKI